MPLDPASAFLVFQSASNQFCRKMHLKKMWKLCPPPPIFKISPYATDYQSNDFSFRFNKQAFRQYDAAMF